VTVQFYQTTRLYIPQDKNLHPHWRESHTLTFYSTWACLSKIPVFINTTIYYGATALVDQGLLIVEDSWSHSVGLLWTSDQPKAKIPTWQHTTLTRDRY